MREHWLPFLVVVEHLTVTDLFVVELLMVSGLAAPGT
jgi:hypothetical protein